MLLTLLGACSATSPSNTWQNDLDAARTRWSTAGLGDYDYLYAFLCGICAPTATEPKALVPTEGDGTHYPVILSEAKDLGLSACWEVTAVPVHPTSPVSAATRARSARTCGCITGSAVFHKSSRVP